MHGRRETKVGVSMDEATETCLSQSVKKMCSCGFAWQAWHFVTFDLFQEQCVRATVVKVEVACLWGKP